MHNTYVTKAFNKVYQLVSTIPKGKVTTYSEIGKCLKISPRIVGFALHANKNPDKVPCHRVVNKEGAVAKNYAFGGEIKQKEILEKEGIMFESIFKVNLNKYFYQLS